MIRFASRGVKPDLTPRPRPAMLYPMRANAIPVLLMCGISAYAGIFRLMLYFLARDRKENLNFALTCLSIALYDAMCVGLYNAQSVSSGVLWQRGQFIAIAVLAFNFANFVLALFEKKSSPFKRPFFVLLATTALAGLAFPELVVSAKDPNLREFGILGLRVTYFEGHVALLMNLLNGLLALAMVYVVAIAVPYVKDHGRKELPYLAIGIGIFFVSLTLDILIASDLLVFLYTSEYSFLILVVLMDFAVQRRYVGLLREVESRPRGEGGAPYEGDRPARRRAFVEERGAPREESHPRGAGRPRRPHEAAQPRGLPPEARRAARSRAQATLPRGPRDDRPR
jgi:hypothetical protein